MEYDGGERPGRGPRGKVDLGPAWTRVRETASDAAAQAAERIRDYDIPSRIDDARARIRAMELDRKAGAVARAAARKAKAGGGLALREGASGARAATRFAMRQSSVAAREAGPIARKAWNKAASGVAAVRARRAQESAVERVERIERAAEIVPPAISGDQPAAASLPLFPAERASLAPARVEPAASRPADAPAPAPARARPFANRRAQWLTGLGGVLLGASAMAVAATQTVTPAAGTPERAAIEQIVRDYILEHPEILPQAMERLQHRETARLLDANRRALEAPFAGAWAGAADGDVVLVQFFDYACGFCRQSVPDLDRLLREDPKLKIVFRELPILGDESGEAAKVSLAAAKQGNFLAFHRAMYAAGRPSATTIDRARASAGLDAGKVTADRNASDVRDEISSNIALARTLGLTGTPSFVIGDRLLSGAVGYDELKRAVDEARRS